MWREKRLDSNLENGSKASSRSSAPRLLFREIDLTCNYYPVVVVNRRFLFDFHEIIVEFLRGVEVKVGLIVDWNFIGM